MMTVLSWKGPRWHDNGAPADGRVPAWRMEGLWERTKIWVCPLGQKLELTWVASNGGGCWSDSRSGRQGKGQQPFYTEGKRVVGFGRRGDAQDRIRKGWRMSLYGLFPSPSAGLAS
jgi:hypothetical protein